jgi:adenylate cyclase
MAIFGSPGDDSYQEDHAILAALEMREAVTKLRIRWQEQYHTDLQIGIGINSGTAIVGNIGSQIHMEYTAIGDTVNLTSRLEAATKELGEDIIISEYTYISASRNRYHFKPLGEIAVKGRADKVKVYGVIDAIADQKEL